MTSPASLSGRRVCEKGIHTYHIEYLPPRKKGYCDVDGSRLVLRKDDAPAIVKERFKVYEKRTAPLIEYYGKRRLLKKVDASGTPQEVYARVKKIL